MKSDLIKASVVIPAHNSEKTIRRAVDSCLNQTYKNIEIIVVDDGSTDGTYDAIKDYITSSKVVYIRQEQCGVASARNAGLEASSGEYIALLDSDDAFYDVKIEKQISHMMENGLEFSFTGYHAQRQGYPLKIHNARKWGNTELIDDLLMENFILTSTVAVKRNTLATVGLFDENFIFCEDWDWFFRMVMGTKSGFLEDHLTIKHNTEGSLSKVYRAKYTCYLQLLNKHIGSLEEGRQKKFRAAIGKKCYVDAEKNAQSGNLDIGLKAFVAAIKLKYRRIFKFPTLLKKYYLGKHD